MLSAPSPDPSRLANASVGKNYEFSLKSLLGLQDTSVQMEDVTVTFNTPCGLEFDPETLMLRGVPTLAGELSVELAYRTTTYKKASLTINPDPSSLWKNLPSDPGGKFATLDQESAYLESPYLQICAASLRGRSHAHEGKYRDDNFAMRYLPESQWHLMVAADGAGSAKYSRRGSELACQITLENLSKALEQANNQLDQDLALSDPNHFSLEERVVKVSLYTPLIHAAWDARTKIDAEAKSISAETKDFHTTALIVIAKKFSFGWFFASFSVGDGGIGIFVDESNVKVLNTPDSGDFGGQTLFLTHPKALSGGNEALMERLNFQVVPHFRWLSLMTDGITDPKFPNDQELHNPLAWSLLESELPLSLKDGAITERSPEELLNWLHFPSPGNHDDRTLIFAVPTQEKEAADASDLISQAALSSSEEWVQPLPETPIENASSIPLDAATETATEVDPSTHEQPSSRTEVELAPAPAETSDSQILGSPLPPFPNRPPQAPLGVGSEPAPADPLSDVSNPFAPKPARSHAEEAPYGTHASSKQPLEVSTPSSSTSERPATSLPFHPEDVSTHP